MLSKRLKLQLEHFKKIAEKPDELNVCWKLDHVLVYGYVTKLSK
jgi:hypothetical protein